MAESDLALTFHPTETQTDITTLIAAARKDPREFGALYQRFVNPLFRYLYNRTVNIHEAEDLTAQTFLIAYETFRRFRGDGQFAAWLFGNRTVSRINSLIYRLKTYGRRLCCPYVSQIKHSKSILRRCLSFYQVNG